MSSPRFTFDGDEPAAHELVPLGHKLLHKVRESAATSGSSVVGLSLAPTPDSYLYALKVGDHELVHVFVAPSSGGMSEPALPPQMPDFISGLVRSGNIVKMTVTGPDGKPMTVEAMNAFRPTADTAKFLKLSDGQDWYKSRRLTVRPAPGFADLQNKLNTNSQYARLRPSMYSGRMRRLVQLVMGYGRLHADQIATTGRDKVNMVQEGVQVPYDYRWHRTHGLTTAADGRLWLLEISISRGVVAMPLPLVPKSARLKDSDRDVLRAAVDEFGGLPLGTAFPTGQMFDAALAEGSIIRLLAPADMAAFYRMTPFSSVIGWSFNRAGTEAHNTGWYWHEDRVKRAAHFSLQIKIGATKKTRRAGEPLAHGTAVLTQVSEGKLFYNSSKNPPPLKFYEPMLGGLLSVDMTAAKDADGAADISVEAVPLCHCTVHVCHVGDELKLVRYFWDRTVNSTQEIVADTSEECMIIGSWKREVRLRSAVGWPMFYTTDFDDRTPIDELQSTSLVTSTDAGWYYTVTDLMDMPIYPQYSQAVRAKLLRTVTEATEYAGGNYNRTAIIVPSGLRDGYVYANLKFRGGSQTTRSVAYRSLFDTVGYLTYRTYFFKPKGKTCYTRLDRKVTKQIVVTDNPCSADISEGSWMDSCDNADSLPKRTVPAPVEATSSSPATQSVTAFLVTDSEFGTMRLDAKGTPDRWLARSPSDMNTTQALDVAHSCWGAIHMAFNTEPDGEQVKLGNLFAGEDSAAAYSYVGFT